MKFLDADVKRPMASVSAVRRHRTSMTADPVEAKAKEDKGGGWRLEAEKLGHESLGTLFLEFAEAEFGEAAPRRAKHLSSWAVHPPGASRGWMSSAKGLAGIHSNFVDFSLRPSSSLWKSVRKARVASWGPPTIIEEESCQIHGAVDGFSLCSSLRESSVEHEGEEEWAKRVALLYSSVAWNPFWAEQDKRFRSSSTSHSGQAWCCSSDFQKKTGLVNLVEGVLQIRGQEAPFFRRCRVSRTNV